MSKNAASEDSLGELHEKVAKIMSNALKTFEVAQERYLESDNIEDVSPPPDVSAPLLSVITKFLSDNKITCAPSDSKELDKLNDIVKQRRAKLRVVNATHDE